MSFDRSIVYFTSGLLDVIGRVDFVDWRRDRCVLTLHQPERNKFYCVSLSSDNQRILTGHLDGSVVERDFVSGAEIHRTQIIPNESIRVDISPDGRFVAVLAGREIKLLHAKDLIKQR